MNDEINNDVQLEAPVAEQTVEAPKEKFDGLSNRDALAEAIKLNREGERPEAPTNKEVAQAVQADIEPPAEFSKEGKEAWKRKDVSAIQREYRRIHDARTAEISRAQRAEREAREIAERERASSKPAKDLLERVKNYLSVRGDDSTPDEVKIAQALQLVEEMRKGDGAAIRAELKKAGIDLDASPKQPTANLPKEVKEELDNLKSYVENEKKEKEAVAFQNTVRLFDSVFANLSSQKTRTGEPVFPDINDSPSGIEFARELGSLTKDEAFQRGVLRRFPDADFSVVVREAYKYLGGRVSGEPVKVSTQSNQQHLQRSRRAAAATPGRTAPRVNDSNLQGKLSNRAALKKALELHREH